MLGVDGTLGLGEVTKSGGGSSSDLDSETGLVYVSKMRNGMIQKVWGLDNGRTYVISPLLDWVVFTLDQGMAAMPWAKRMAETVENFILKKG